MIDLASKLRHIPDYPKPGIDFIDITTLLKDPVYFQESILQLADTIKDLDFDLIIGSESRGFIIGAPLAYALKKGFSPVRKKGKLPYDTIKAFYSLEYGEDCLEIHIDAIQKGQKVLIVDDLLATGGTANANCELVEKLGGEVVALLFLIELNALKGRQKLLQRDVRSIIEIP